VVLCSDLTDADEAGQGEGDVSEERGQRSWFSEISCPTLMLDLRQATEARMFWARVVAGEDRTVGLSLARQPLAMLRQTADDAGSPYRSCWPSFGTNVFGVLFVMCAASNSSSAGRLWVDAREACVGPRRASR